MTRCLKLEPSNPSLICSHSNQIFGLSFLDWMEKRLHVMARRGKCISLSPPPPNPCSRLALTVTRVNQSHTEKEKSNIDLSPKRDRTPKRKTDRQQGTKKTLFCFLKTIAKEFSYSHSPADHPLSLPHPPPCPPPKPQLDSNLLQHRAS